MQDSRHAYTKRYQEAGNDSPSIALPVGVSFLFHLVLIGVLIFMPEFGSRYSYRPGVVNVSLVSLPAPGTASAGAPAAAAVSKPVEEKLPEKAAVKVPKPKPAPVVKKPPEAVSLAPKPKPKKAKESLKQKTIDTQKVIDSAIEKIEEKVEKTETDSVVAAIDQLKRKVAASESRAEEGPGGASGKAGTGPTGPAGGYGDGGARRAQESILIYQAEIQYQIQKNWAFSQQLAGDSTQQEAILAIKIQRNGEIEDIWFDKKSGNTYLDESAYKAVVKSNPLPALPNDYMHPFYEVGLRFGPKGLKNE
jgi:colicin import membrane protein